MIVLTPSVDALNALLRFLFIKNDVLATAPHYSVALPLPSPE